MNQFGNYLECSVDNKILNIAIVINHDIYSGGGFQYSYMVLNLLKKYHNDKTIKLSFYSINKDISNDYQDLDLEIKKISENLFQKIHRIALKNLYFYNFFKKLGLRKSKIESKILKDGIDLIYFLSPSQITHSLSELPYIITLWDLGHLNLIEFPELSNNKIFEGREENYSKSLKKAINIIVDSTYLKNYCISKYNLEENRIEILPFLPNVLIVDNKNYINIKEKYNIKNDYIFYPAQFWAHKNHMYILKAIKILRYEHNIDVSVVFSGSNKGNLNYILKSAKSMGIENLIHYVGFVKNEEIPYLYKQSLSLVMPTYLGPTNIPPLEAFAYETPVCYSDMPFFREQFEESVFFMDLNNPNSLSENILFIKNNKDIVDYKILNGKNILDNWKEEDFYNKLLKVFKRYQYIRECWE